MLILQLCCVKYSAGSNLKYLILFPHCFLSLKLYWYIFYVTLIDLYDLGFVLFILFYVRDVCFLCLVNDFKFYLFCFVFNGSDLYDLLSRSEQNPSSFSLIFVYYLFCFRHFANFRHWYNLELFMLFKCLSIFLCGSCSLLCF